MSLEHECSSFKDLDLCHELALGEWSERQEGSGHSDTPGLGAFVVPLCWISDFPQREPRSGWNSFGRSSKAQSSKSQSRARARAFSFRAFLLQTSKSSAPPQLRGVRPHEEKAKYDVMVLGPAGPADAKMRAGPSVRL